jgi:phosphorylcholine metabolism protein LicD
MLHKYREKDFYLDPKFYKKLYKLMIVVNNIFIKNDIQYWGVSGTTLGALRHKGIISWDDDIDISVWKQDWLRILKPEIINQFKKLGYTVLKERGLNLIKIFPSDATEYRSNYGFPFIDIFSVTLDKKNPKKIVYTHKWAREGWPKDFLYLDEIYPLKYVKFGASKIIVPNKADKYLDRMFGSSWSKEGRIYQSHLLRIDLDKPIIVNGPFTPAKDFDYSILKIPDKNFLEYPPQFIINKLK